MSEESTREQIKELEKQSSLLYRMLWRLKSKEQKAKTVLKTRELLPEEFVTVKCLRCGRKYCFCPTTVMFAPKCECGNDNIGDCRYWSKGNFGNFKVVQIYTLTLPPLF